ncbi:component of IIS longevity pathway SMK-1-domain-containing protein [Dissophora ornata]|nr:component of IIS longevity pathway SMK-1-domain-containing protein [Dissophora ornata]
MDPNARMRVKVYKLSAGNQWIDQGTGHCSCEFNLDKSEGTLIVQSEDEEDKFLLRTRIRVGEDLYQRQQETLIVWSEENGEDLALSFQEAEGCGEIWDNINEVQQHYAEDLFSDPSDVNGVGSGEFISLPDPDISNLAEIENLIKEAQNGMNEKEKLAAFIIIDNYIDKLFPILETCEDLESRSDLHLLHGIMLGIIMLNDIAIIQYILKDEVIVGCLGMLEYDPEFGDQKEEYREFLTKRAKYKQIIPINDPEVEQKIHQAYRLHFLRDTVLSRVVDESLSSILGSLIFFHNIDIVNYIHQDRAFLKELFGILENESEPLERKRDVILFVQQFCSIAKTTQLPTRVGLYRTLSQTGLFNVFETALSDSDRKIKMAGAEIFLSAMEHDPNLVRSYIVKQAEEKSSKQLMDIILDQFLAEEDMGIKLQYSEVIRMLLDTNTNQGDNGMPVTLDSMPNLDPDADKFLELFYNPYVGKFVSPLLELSEDSTIFTRPVATLCENICQILSFMVRHHSFRSKYYVLSSGVVGKVCLLLKNRDQHLRLSALRFFRTCIGLNDEFYHRYLIKHNIIQHIVDALLSTHNKNNLLNSACIEFFDFIRNENIRSLISHVVPLYGDKLKNIEYVNTFKVLIRRYEQQQDSSVADAEAAEAAASETSSAKRGALDQKAWSSTTVDDDEEAYFNNSDDEDEVPDEGKHEDDPPASDLRRRVKEGSDDDLEHDVSMEKDTAPVLASQTSLSPPTSLLRRKLVDYGEDEDDEDDEGAFNWRSRVLAKSTGASGSSTLPPPEKRIKLDSEEAENIAQQDQVMSDSADSQRTTPVNEGSSAPIKFKLNNMKNGRSPSPLSSPNSRPRSVSPLPSGSNLPPAVVRTGIVFVKAGSANSDGGHPNEGEVKAGSSGDKDHATQAAIHLRSDLARDFKRSVDDDEDPKLNGQPPVSIGPNEVPDDTVEATKAVATDVPEFESKEVAEEKRTLDNAPAIEPANHAE